jgi:homoserine kinase
MLPLDPTKNTATVAANTFLRTIGAQHGVAMTLKKGLPLASGLGSSAASAVAAVVAVNALYAEPLRREELLPACLAGEALAARAYHPDNVTPSLMGGITLILSEDTTKIRHLPVPPGLYFALITPNIAIPTALARAVLPDSVPLKTMVAQTASIASLVDALHRGDVAAVAAAMEQDRVIEPARAHLIPLFIEVRAKAKDAGALGIVISGAGPTLCAICDAEDTAHCVANAMQAVYDEAGIGGESRVTQVDEQGARVIRVL